MRSIVVGEDTPRLTSKIKNILLMFDRSDKDHDDWSFCSESVWPLIEDFPRELYEYLLKDDRRYVRLTEEAKILLKWIK